MRTPEEKREYMQKYYRENRHRWKKRTPEQQAEYNERRRAKYATCESTSSKARAKAREWQQAVCTSTIAMQRELSGGCCAGTAITGLESSKTQSRYSNQRQCTCDDGKPKGRILISKARVLGFGLNLQIATRQVFSGLQDSYEEFYQAVKRSNRVGSTKPLNVHIPITELEEPMIQTVLEKAKRVQADTEQQEKLFLEVAMNSPERIGRSKGYAAGYEGLPRTDNPGGVEGDAWDRGWVDGNASIQNNEPAQLSLD